MTFDEWFSAEYGWPGHDEEQKLFKLLMSKAWNAALEEAALLVETHTDAVHTPDRIRDLKTERSPGDNGRTE